MNINYKLYTELKLKGEKERLEREKAEREKNRFQPESLKALDEKITENDVLLLHDLSCAFFEDLPARVYQGFLDDHGYSDEDFIRVMNRLKRLKDKMKNKK
jgi:hypothetical protein